MTGKQLKNSILQWAIQGKLVPQDPNDEPASVLLEKIRAEKERLVKEGKIKRDKKETIIYRGEDNSYYEKVFATGDVKCIDEEIPFEIPQSWEWCRMGTIGEWGAGATPAKGNPEYYNNGNVLWLRTGELNNDVVYDTEIKITNIALKECSLRLNKVGDVMIAMYGATIGKVAIVGTEMTTNQACCACTPIGIFNWFLFYFLMGSQLDFIRKGEGGAQPNISREKLISHLMPIPPLTEQHRIVRRVKEVLPYIDKYSFEQTLLNTLNNNIKPLLRKSILQEAIQGKLVSQDPNDEPASALLQRIKEEKQRLVKKGKLKKKDIVDSVIFKGDDNKYYEQIDDIVTEISDAIPFDIPDTWQWVRFGQLATLHIGKTPTRGDARYWSNATKHWVSISDMKEYGQIKNTKEKISDAASSLMGTCSPIGTLLMSFKLTVGRTSILDIEAYHNEAIVSIYPYIDNKFAFRNYLFYVLPILANMGNSKNAIKGKTLNSKSLNSLLIPLPSLSEQQRIVDMIETIFGRIKI